MLSVKVYDVPERLSTEDVRNVLAELPEWRLQKAMSYRFDIDRFLCAESFLMLEGMLGECFGLTGVPAFSFGKHSKPFLKEYPGIHFNISHCRKGIACAVSDRPVGIDIETVLYDAALAEMTLSAEEKAEVEISDEPGVRFTELWTRKESFLKLTGEGVRDNLKDVLKEAENVCFRTETNLPAGYVLTVSRRR